MILSLLLIDQMAGILKLTVQPFVFLRVSKNYSLVPQFIFFSNFLLDKTLNFVYSAAMIKSSLFPDWLRVWLNKTLKIKARLWYQSLSNEK
jgi:hypothetical protein